MFVLLLSVMPHAYARESFRVPRPVASDAPSTCPGNLSDSALSFSAQELNAKTDFGMFGQYIFAGMRTPLSIDSFERWRQNYCDPIICNMVLCKGSCVDFEEHCPSLSDSNRVIHIHDADCMHSDDDALKADGKECCSDNI